MAIVILPDAQEDLLALQEYMLDKWSEADWVKAEDEVFDKLALLDTGVLTGAPVQELASVGIFEYQHVFTSHHKLACRRISGDVYVYLVAGHRQDFPTLLMRRLLKIQLQANAHSALHRTEQSSACAHIRVCAFDIPSRALHQPQGKFT